MKKIIFLSTLFIVNILIAQVGINTLSPKATLDVRKSANPALADGILAPRVSADSLQLKDNLYDISMDGTVILVSTAVSQSSASPKTKGLTSPGFYTYNANYTHTDGTKGLWQKFSTTGSSGLSAYAFGGSNGITLLDLSLSIGPTFKTLGLSTMTARIGQSNINSNNQYVVPESGIYMINYSYKLGTGISTTLLAFSSNTGPTIIKTSAGVSEMIDNKRFGGVDLGLAKVSLSQTHSANLYELKAGDVLNFGVITSGLDLSILGNVSADISVYKIN